LLKIKTPLILMLVSLLLFCADLFGGDFLIGNIVSRFYPCQQDPISSFPCQGKWDLQFLFVCFWIFVGSVLSLIIALLIRKRTDFVKKM